MSKDRRERPGKSGEWDAKNKALQIGHIVREKHAEEIVLFQVSKLTSLADFFVICSAESEPQVRAIADAVEAFFSNQGIQPLGIEGQAASVWLLIDYGDVILHIFKEASRTFYNLDGLWGDAPRIELSDKEDETDLGGSG